MGVLVLGYVIVWLLFVFLFDGVIELLIEWIIDKVFLVLGRDILIYIDRYYVVYVFILVFEERILNNMILVRLLG